VPGETAAGSGTCFGCAVTAIVGVPGSGAELAGAAMGTEPGFWAPKPPAPGRGMSGGSEDAGLGATVGAPLGLTDRTGMGGGPPERVGETIGLFTTGFGDNERPPPRRALVGILDVEGGRSGDAGGGAERMGRSLFSCSDE
jgi:hypothetical protein